MIPTTPTTGAGVPLLQLVVGGVARGLGLGMVDPGSQVWLGLGVKANVMIHHGKLAKGSVTAP